MTWLTLLGNTDARACSQGVRGNNSVGGQWLDTRICSSPSDASVQQPQLRTPGLDRDPWGFPGGSMGTRLGPGASRANLQKTLGTYYLLCKYGYTLALRSCWSEYNDKACVLLNCNFFKDWAFLTGLDILHSGYRRGEGVRMKGWSR